MQSLLLPQESVTVLKDYGASAHVNHSPLQLCEGDCDTDAQCADGLICFQRNGLIPVPGCAGTGKKDYDYCVKTQPNILKDYGASAHVNHSPLQLCEGDCDTDLQCADGLMCFQRNGFTPVPGCLGSGKQDYDYCIKKQPILKDYGASAHVNHSPLQLCEGDCDTDAQCADGLICFQRNGLIPVPGCAGTGKKDYDYCVKTQPNILKDYGASAHVNHSPLQLCEGDCDTDLQCADGLMCFQRNGFTPVPGCLGSGKQDYDYCIKKQPTNMLKDYGASAHVNHSPLQLCEGDCDTDSQCADGLICFQRDGLASVPGCLGSGKKDYDYCTKKPTAFFRTPNKYEYMPVVEFSSLYSSGYVLFLVRATNDAHIALGVDTKHNGEHYEILLGGWKNTYSVIRGGNQSNKIASYSGPVLDATGFVLFGIAWDDNMLKVYRSSDHSPSNLREIMEFDDRSNSDFNYEIKHMMISTGWGSTGDWDITDHHSTQCNNVFTAPPLGIVSITEGRLHLYKSYFPNNERIQALTLEELNENTKGVNPSLEAMVQRLQNVQAVAKLSTELETAAALGVSDCVLNIGYVVFDVICLAIGGVGLRGSMSASTARALGEAVEPVIPKIVEICAKISRDGASFYDQAKGVFQILSTIWSGGMLGAVVGAFVGSLTWYNALLYGVTALGTIVAALATDGAALIAEVAVELATFGFLVVDSVNAATTCSS